MLHDSKIDLAKIAEHYARRICWADKDLEERDKRLMAEAVWLRYFLLLDLTDDPRCAQGYKRALLSLSSLDARLYALTVKGLRQNVLSSLNDYHRGALDDLVQRFKPSEGGMHYKCIVTPLSWIERSKIDDETVLLRAIQWVSFDTKLNMPGLDLSAELSAEYLDDEYRMKTFTYDRDLISDLNHIVKEWCESYTASPETSPYRFRHGNGATLEVSRARASSVRKSLYFAITPDVKRYLNWRGSSEGLDYRDLTIDPYDADEIPIPIEFVPKSPLTNRVISKERISKMWVQNDLFSIMDDLLSTSVKRVDLHDQSKSRHLAKIGSVDGKFDTFDYSKASDFVTWTLVDGITADTWLHDPLWWTRSRYVTVGESTKGHVGLDKPITIPLEKFAPMGSSTCFPTESLVFSAVCELAIRRTLGRRSRSRDYQVYGDDVVIRSDCSDELRFLSALLHFSVNDDKSFRTKGRYIFREACGIECLNGCDVTPLRLSRRYVGCTNIIKDMTATPGEVLGCIDFYNRCYLYGFTNLRRALTGVLSLWKGYSELFRISCDTFSSLEKSWKANHVAQWSLPVPYIITDIGTDTNYRVPVRRNSRLQKTEFRCLVLRGDRRSIKDVPYAFQQRVQYFNWLSQALIREDYSRGAGDFITYVERSFSPADVSLRWVRRWVSSW